MKKVIKYCVVIAFLFLFSACKHELNKLTYASYVQDKNRGLKKTVKVDNWEYNVQYKPYDYIMLLESKGDFRNYDSKKRLQNLYGTAWFNISFKLADGSISPLRYNLSSKEEYEHRFNFFLNDAIHDLQLVYDKKDTLQPIGYLFENNFNLTPQETMVVGFKLPEGNQRPDKDMQLSYNDRVFKNGIIKVTYKSNDLKKIPNLIY